MTGRLPSLTAHLPPLKIEALEAPEDVAPNVARPLRKMRQCYGEVNVVIRTLRALRELRPRRIAELSRQVAQLQASTVATQQACEAITGQIANYTTRQDEQTHSLTEMRRALDRLEKRATKGEKRVRDTDLKSLRAELSTAIEAQRAVLITIEQQLKRQEVSVAQCLATQRSDALLGSRTATSVALLEAPATAEHTKAAIAGAELHTDPYPYFVVDDLLPDKAFDALLAALPPRPFFEDREVNDQQLKLSAPQLPAHSKAVGAQFLALVHQVIGPAIVLKLQSYLRDYVHTISPTFQADSVNYQCTAARVLLRRPGLVIRPHRDPKWAFGVALFNLARPGDREAYGTQLYRVRDDQEAPSQSPFWIDSQRCEPVADIPFKRNRLLAFVNAAGAHGATIPSDAPANTERYQLQFRLIPDEDSIRRLAEAMTPEQLARWRGGKLDRLGVGGGY